MDPAAAFSSINWLAVLLATLSAFGIGGVWYGPLFGRAWMHEFKIAESDLQRRSASRTFGIALLLSLVAAINLKMFIGPKADIAFGAMAGFLAGLGWVAAFLGILYVFEMKSMRAFGINAGYCVLSLTVMGAVLGAF